MDETGESSVLLVARCLVAGLFLWSGLGQVNGYDEAALLLHEHGVFGLLLPVAIFVEIAGGLLLIIGFKVRFVALVLAGFCVVTALLFHANFADRAQVFHLVKNFAIVGGLLALYVAGPGRMSFDAMADSAESSDPP